MARSTDNAHHTASFSILPEYFLILEELSDLKMPKFCTLNLHRGERHTWQKHFTIEQELVRSNIFQAQIGKLSASTIIMFYELLKNVASVKKHVTSVSENSWNSSFRIAKTTFRDPLSSSRVCPEIAGTVCKFPDVIKGSPDHL